MHNTSPHLSNDDFEVKAGDRMPYFEINGKSVYDRLRAPKFHLLRFSDAAEVDNNPKVASEYAELLDHHSIPLHPKVVEMFGADKPFDVLLRPDNYIGFISSDTSGRQVSLYFAHLRHH